MFSTRWRKGLSAAAVLLPVLWFVLFVYGGYLLGARVITHDTQLSIYPSRAYYSDSLHAGIFPMWDPYSNKGVPAGAGSTMSAYSPVAFLIMSIFRYTLSTATFELMVTSTIALLGMYAWLKRQGASTPLALSGAFAFAGSPQLVTGTACYVLALTIALLPLLFWSFHLVVFGPDTRTRRKGVIFFSLCMWEMLTGGYFGFITPFFVFLAFYTIGEFVGEKYDRNTLRSAIIYSAVGGAIALSLAFIPLSEFVLTYLGQFSDLRKMSGSDPFDPYLEHLPKLSILTFIFPNGAFLGNKPGADTLYFSAALFLAIPALLVQKMGSRKELLLIALAILVVLASMGKNCPVAVFFVNFVPGFGSFRFHIYMGCLAVFFLITASVLLINRYIEQPTEPSRLVKMIAASCGTFAFLAFLAWHYCGEQVLPSGSPCVSEMTMYEIMIDIFIVLTSIVTIMTWMWITRRPENAPTVRTAHFFCALPFVLGALASFAYKSLPLDWRWELLRRLCAGYPSKAFLAEWGLFKFLDSSPIVVADNVIFLVGVLQAFVSFVAFLLVLNAMRSRTRQWCSWTLAIVVFLDAGFASYRHQQGNLYWVTAQSGVRERDFNLEPYRNNERVAAYSYDTAWGRGLNNPAITARTPTFRSYNPFINPKLEQIDLTPEGRVFFTKLVWLVPHEHLSSVNEIEQYHIEPEVLEVSILPNSTEITVQCSQKCVLVYTDGWADGWNASVNGKTADILKVVGCVKGIQIEQGNSHIILRYRPALFVVGIILFAGAAILLLYFIGSVISSDVIQTTGHSP